MSSYVLTPTWPVKDVLLLHLNAFGMILHMKQLEKPLLDPFNRPLADKHKCIGRALSELLPNDIGLKILAPISDALIEGPSGKAHIFNYQLRHDKRYQARITYLRPDTVLAVIHEL